MHALGLVSKRSCSQAWLGHPLQTFVHKKHKAGVHKYFALGALVLIFPCFDMLTGAVKKRYIYIMHVTVCTVSNIDVFWAAVVSISCMRIRF